MAVCTAHVHIKDIAQRGSNCAVTVEWTTGCVVVFVLGTRFGARVDVAVITSSGVIRPPRPDHVGACPPRDFTEHRRAALRIFSRVAPVQRKAARVHADAVAVVGGIVGIARAMPGLVAALRS